MANAAIAYENLADAGTVTAQTAASLMPATRVQNPHVRRVWRSTGSSAWLLLDRASDLAMDTFGVFGLSASTIRMRVSTQSGGPTSGDLLDTGVLSGYPSSAYFDPDYASFVYPAVAALTGRYVRFDLTGVSYVEAGRLLVASRTAFPYNFIAGSSRGWVDPSARQKTLGGQTLTDERPAYRTMDLNFDLIPEALRHGLVETIDRVNGRRRDILLIEDSAAANLPMRSVWGLVRDLTPPAVTASAQIFTKLYQVEERL